MPKREPRRPVLFRRSFTGDVGALRFAAVAGSPALDFVAVAVMVELRARAVVLLRRITGWVEDPRCVPLKDIALSGL